MKEELLHRTKKFAIDGWKLCQTLPNEFLDYKKQLVRSTSSVGANYRAACRAKSTNDFINKLKIVEEELDEPLFFMELILKLSPKENNLWKSMHDEGDQLLAILVKSITKKKKKQNYKS